MAVSSLLRGGRVAMLVLAAAACTRLVDMDALCEEVADSVGERFELEVASVECPESRELRADDAFECVVTTGGGATIVVDILQLEDSEFSFSYPETHGLLFRERLAADIQAGLLAQGLHAQVDCGSGYDDTAPGESFECEAQGAQQSVTVVVTVQDREGRVGWSLAGDPPS